MHAKSILASSNMYIAWYYQSPYVFPHSSCWIFFYLFVTSTIFPDRSIDTLIGMNNEEICWEMKSSKKKKKSISTKEKNSNLPEGKKLLFSRDSVTREEKKRCYLIL